jgi:hypothetical protein
MTPARRRASRAPVDFAIISPRGAFDLAVNYQERRRFVKKAIADEGAPKQNCYKTKR